MPPGHASTAKPEVCGASNEGADDWAVELDILDHPGHPGTDCSALVAEASLARTGQEYFAIPAGFVVKSPRNHGFLLRLELGLPVFLGEEKNKT